MIPLHDAPEFRAPRRREILMGALLISLCVFWVVTPRTAYAAGVGKIIALINQLHGAPLAGTAPSDDNVMTYDSATGQWGPEAPAGGAAETWAATLTAGAVSGGADPSLSTGDDLISVAELDITATDALTLLSGTTDDAASLKSGNNGAGDSGDVTVDAGTATGTAGNVNIGNTSAVNVNIGNAGSTTAFTGTVTGDNLNVVDTLAATLGAAADANAVAITNSGGFALNDDATLKFGTAPDMLMSGETTTLGAETAVEVLAIQTSGEETAMLTLHYKIHASDSAGPNEYQVECGTLQVAIVVDDGGVVASTPGEVSVQAVSSGTLTSVWTIDTTDDDDIELKLASVSSLTQTTHTVSWVAIYSANVSITVP